MLAPLIISQNGAGEPPAVIPSVIVGPPFDLLRLFASYLNYENMVTSKALSLRILQNNLVSRAGKLADIFTGIHATAVSRNSTGGRIISSVAWPLNIFSGLYLRALHGETVWKSIKKRAGRRLDYE